VGVRVEADTAEAEVGAADMEVVAAPTVCPSSVCSMAGTLI
jgi:hypothetical protein